MTNVPFARELDGTHKKGCHPEGWQLCRMRARGGGEPAGALKEAIQRDFGGFKDFRTAFAKAATGEFGSGWVWLIENNGGTLEIAATDNADTPLVRGHKPLIALDVWEHAYYLDFQNRRPDYVAAWLDKLVNWGFAERNHGETGAIIS